LQREGSSGVISNQATLFASAGFEILGRFGLALTMPVTLVNTAENPSNLGITNGINVNSAAAGDLRLDTRALVYKTPSEGFRFGVAGSYFIPTGNRFSFTGDGSGHVLGQLLFEEKVGPFILTENLGVHFRKSHDVGDLAFSNEATFAAGLFLPLREGRLRLGLQLHGSTGIATETRGARDEQKIETFFTKRNTPLEWLGEVRLALDKDKQWWLGGGAGTLLLPGYSAPVFRGLVQVGFQFGITDSHPASPNRKFIKSDERVEDMDPDTDGDGIPDSLDACPTVPEDHKGPKPDDGCPAPTDRDGDGIYDADDKCPDQAEDRDGIADDDGCPEDDFDQDGILDIKDACPREPGQPSPDPKKNGCPQFIKRIEGSTEIQILKKIEFDTGKASIKATSFPILDEIVKLLAINTNIKKVSVEGHTDNRGAAQMNKDLSQARSESVMKHMIDKGVDANRLSATGWGPEKPIASNNTDDGRARNRRVEFHILEQ